MNFKSLKDTELMDQFKNLVDRENRLTAEIVDYIKEISTRRLYLKNHSSLFDFLTKEMGYSNASAQRRIDAAKMMKDLPQTKVALASGELNLSQAAMVEQMFRFKKKQDPGCELTMEDKARCLDAIKNKTTENSQQALCAELDIKPIVKEKKRLQQDESVRLEITLNKDQMAIIQRAREVLSHSLPGATNAELFTYLAEFLIQKRDPLVKKPAKRTAKSQASAAEVEGAVPENRGSDPAVVAATSASEVPVPASPNIRRKLSAATLRAVHQRDVCCQWRDRETGEICGTRFQTQADHIQPLWAGGSDKLENMQILCAAHNRMKYRSEAGIRCH
jgi:hypothetical protein